MVHLTGDSTHESTWQRADLVRAQLDEQSFWTIMHQLQYFTSL